jgi:sigma-B regulation protein RsbU (phosphoserine phosphatase)
VFFAPMISFLSGLSKLRPTTRFGKVSLVIVAAYLALNLASLAISPPGGIALLVNLALFVVIVRYSFRLMRWLSSKLLWRLRRRLIVTYLLVGVVPVILLFSIMVILGFAFFGQLSSYYVSNEFDRLSTKLEAANRSMAGPLLSSLSGEKSTVDYWNREFSPLVSSLGKSFSTVRIEAKSPAGEVSLELEKGRLVSVSKARSIPAWVQEDTNGLFEEEGKVYFTSVVSPGGAQNHSWVMLRAPLDAFVLRRISEHYQVSIDIYTLVPVSAYVRRNGIAVNLKGRNFTQRDVLPVDAGNGKFTARLNWYDFKTPLFPFFLPGVRIWDTGKPLEDLRWMYLMSSTWQHLANRFFAEGFGTDENVIPYLLAAVSVFFLIIEFVALLSSLLMTRTITGAVHNLDEGAQHIMRGDFSHRIRVKSRDQLSSLAETFNTMTASIERLLKEQAEKQRLESELAIALEVQKQLFPRSAPKLNSLQIAGICNPARIVSGDYFDYLLISPTTIGLALGDVSGKGVSAALLMASLQASLRSHSNLAVNHRTAMVDSAAGSAALPYVVANRVAEIVSLLNRHLLENTSSEKYVTFFYGIYDEWQRKLTYTNAGHLPPLVFSSHGVLRLETGGTVLGLIEDAQYEQGVIHLAPQDVLVAYTDGITEAENSFDEQFGERRLIEVVQQSLGKPPDEILQAILMAVHDWVDVGEPQDDMTLIVARAT